MSRSAAAGRRAFDAMPPTAVCAADVTPQPWRNGGGRTRALLAWPAGAGWKLRISLADIDADGPFSAFPGVTRWFVVLQGEGVALRFAEDETVLRPGDAPLCFDGAAAPGCRLLGGPTRDLNLMLRDTEGELIAARAGAPAPARWPQRGYFEAAARRLHWPFGGDVAPADGWWIGAGP
jgi:hypothetical protein